jgi:hypothetical protein
MMRPPYIFDRERVPVLAGNTDQVWSLSTVKIDNLDKIAKVKVLSPEEFNRAEKCHFERERGSAHAVRPIRFAEKVRR